MVRLFRRAAFCFELQAATLLWLIAPATGSLLRRTGVL